MRYGNSILTGFGVAAVKLVATHAFELRFSAVVPEMNVLDGNRLRAFAFVFMGDLVPSAFWFFVVAIFTGFSWLGGARGMAVGVGVSSALYSLASIMGYGVV